MKKIDVYVDGACSSNGFDGIGGWACVITNGTKDKILSGGELHTTNNRMELMAIIKAIEGFKSLNIPHEHCGLRIYSDSAYAVNGLNRRWVKKWIINGWKTSSGSNVLNRDLWEILDTYDKELNIQLIKVKGHNGDEYNELCDRIAKDEVNKLKGAK